MLESRSSTSGSYTESHCMNMKCALPTSQHIRKEGLILRGHQRAERESDLLIDKIPTSSSRRSALLCLLFFSKHQEGVGNIVFHSTREFYYNPNPSSTPISTHNAFFVAPHPHHLSPPPYLHHLPPLRHLPIFLSRATTPPQRRPRTLRAPPTILDRRLQHPQTHRTPCLHTNPTTAKAPADQPISVLCT